MDPAAARQPLDRYRSGADQCTRGPTEGRCQGIPYSGINTSYNTTGTVSSADGDILVSLNQGHEPTDKFIRLIRQRLHHDFPDVTYWFPADDIVSQVLNFGLPAPIDVQISGSDSAANSACPEDSLGGRRR
jgi:hypothetical protein